MDCLASHGMASPFGRLRRLKSAMISCHIYGVCVTITGQISDQASIWWVKASFFPIITLW